MPKGMTPKKRMGQRRTKPLRKALAGIASIIKARKTKGRSELQEFKDIMKNVKARRKAGATDSSSRLKNETAYNRARKLKPSGRLNAADLRRAAGSKPAQRKKKLKGN
jgi:hypothetical protein